MHIRHNFNSTSLNNDPFKTLIPLFIATILAAYLSSLQVDAFYDRQNYLVYAESASKIVKRYYSSGILHLLFNEPLWLQINILLGSFLSKESVLRVIIFFSTFISFYLVAKNNYKYLPWVLLIIILPQVIKNNIVHLRQGLALSFFLIGWYSNNKIRRRLFTLASPFIHSSFFFILFIYFITNRFDKINLSSGIKSIVIILFGITLSIAIPFLSFTLGARQAGSYDYIGTAGSGMAFIFWAIVLTLYVCNGKRFIKAKSFEIGMLIFYLSIYFFTPVSARIFEDAILLVLVAGLYLTKWRRNLFLTFFLFYFTYLYYGRLGAPLLGWAVKA